MDFTPSDERALLAESLRRLLADTWDAETRASDAYAHPYHRPEVWAALAEMGVLAAFVDVDHGGLGGSGFDLVAVFHELGVAACPEPLLAGLLSARLLAAVGAEEELQAVLAGRRVVVGYAEAHDHEDLVGITTTARRADDGWYLDGRKSVVYGGPGADVVLVTARVDHDLALFAVDAAATERHHYGLVDGGGASEFVLAATPGRLLAHDVLADLEAVVDAGRLALCAEAVGAMERLVDDTVRHLRARRQFGRPLASFQALRHRVVDLSVLLEQSRSITVRAAADLGSPAGPRSVALAKHLVGRAARQVAEEAIQLHGGIGMTWEYPGAHVAKRLVMLDAQLGDQDHQVTRVVAMDPRDPVS